MAQYPAELEERITTDTGLSVLIRPVKHNDVPLLKAFFYTLSPQSVYNRFLTPIHEVTDEQVVPFADVDYDRTMAIAAVIFSEHGEQIIGVARYVKRDDHSADVAVVVSDKLQNHGIGTLLLDRITKIAIKQGIEVFHATVDPQNRKLLNFVHSLGFENKLHFEEGFLELVSHIK